MATNNFKPFAIGSDANVTAQADYEALAALTSGFQAGKASSAQINKALRQATVIGSALAQFIANESGEDVLDDGDVDTLLTNLQSGISAFLPGRLLNIQVFKSSGTYTKTSGAKKAQPIVLGAGGAGGGCAITGTNQFAAGAGGSAGTFAKGELIDLDSVNSVSVVVGAGGKATTEASTSGGTGGESSFGDYISCPGGIGGGFGSAASAYGSFSDTMSPTTDASGNNILYSIPGEGGGGVMGAYNPSDISSYNPAIMSGKGGSSCMGNGGAGKNGLASSALDGTGFGSGGGGNSAGEAISAIRAGGDGADGIVIVLEFA